MSEKWVTGTEGIGLRDRPTGVRRAGVYAEVESTERREGYKGWNDNSKPGEEEGTGSGGRGAYTEVVVLEVGPGHDLVAFSTWRIELDSDTQAGDPHRPLCAKAFDGLQETPSGHGA